MRPMNERPLVSIITVFWNGEALVPRWAAAVQASAKAQPFALEALAVDNASGDNTAALLDHAGAAIRVLRQATNGGFAAGCNAGLRAARGEYLLLLNPDAEINPRALAAMVRVLGRRRDIGAVGCEIVDEHGRARPAAHDEPSWRSYWATHSLFSRWLAVGDEQRGRRERRGRWGQEHEVAREKRRGALSLRRCDWLMGSCIMTRADVVKRVGLLDEDYFLYSEDTDWCRRIRNAGYRVALLRGAPIMHVQGASARRVPEFTFRRLYRSLLRYATLHLSPMQALALRASVAADLLLRVPIYAATGRWARLRSTLLVLALVAMNAPEWKREKPPA